MNTSKFQSSPALLYGRNILTATKWQRMRNNDKRASQYFDIAEATISIFYAKLIQTIHVQQRGAW